jgi:hypothetical protein
MVIAGACVVGACAPTGGVAPLEGPSTADGAGQQEAATVVVECLVDRGIPAKWTEVDGEIYLDLETDAAFLLCTPEGACTESTGQEGDSEAADRLFAEMEEKVKSPGANAARLFLGAKDRTDDLVGCIAGSGYEAPSMQAMDPREELAAKAESAAVTNVWITCAREHGLPQLEDVPAPVADNLATWPTALLPTKLTVPEFTALLELCPVIQAVGQRGAETPGAGVSSGAGDEVAVLGFDCPGWRGVAAETSTTSSEMEAHLAELSGVLAGYLPDSTDTPSGITGETQTY